MNKPPSQRTPADDQGVLLDYLITLAKYSRKIVFFSASIAMLTYFILFILPNKYTAKVRLLPPHQNLTISSQLIENLGGSSPLGVGSTSFGDMAAGLMGFKSGSALYGSMLKGDTITGRIVERFNLQKIYRYKLLEDARKALQNNARITTGAQDGVITIEVTDPDPKRAAAIANAFPEELDGLLGEITRKEAQKYLTFLEQERNQANSKFTQAEQSLQAFSEKSGVLQIDAQTKGMIQYIAELRALIDAKEVQLRVLRQQATPANFDVIRLETELKGLEQKLQAAETKQTPNIGPEVMIAASRVPGLGLEYFRLYREWKFQEVLYQLYCKMIELARLEASRNFSSVQVIDWAGPPERRSNRRLFPALLAGSLAFFFGVCAAFMWESFQQLANKESEVQRLQLLSLYLRTWTDLFKRVKSSLLLRRPFNKD